MARSVALVGFSKRATALGKTYVSAGARSARTPGRFSVPCSHYVSEPACSTSP